MKNKNILLLIAATFLFCTQSHGQLTFWNNLELYYPFNNNALDYSGNGWDANPIDVTPIEGVFGDPNGAYHFNGSTSRVVRNVLSLPDSSTFSCWIYSELDSQAAPIIYNGHTAHAGFGVFMKKPFGNFGSGYRGKTLVVHQGGASESYFNNLFEVPTQQWLHLALVHRGPTIELYLNGIFQASAPYVANNPYGEFSLGASTDHITVGYPAFMGKIDEVMVFTSALSSQNVYKVFQSNLTESKDLIGKTNNLVVYPNPARGKFEVAITDGKAIDELQVLDAKGKTWFTANLSNQTNQLSTTIQLPNTNSGVNFLKVRSGGKTSIRRIVIE
jgi:Concanavalin A-like lectin/glucanases superfamily/Secretion system C-terminal sorting domain